MEWTDGYEVNVIDGVIEQTLQHYEDNMLMMQENFLFFYGYTYEEED